jgi:hypothetical protein
MEQREDGKWKRYKLLKLHVLFNFFFLHLGKWFSIRTMQKLYTRRLRN